MKYGFLLWLLLTGAAYGQSKVQPLRIAVAANAQFVMEKLQEAFQKESGIIVEPIINSSGRLTTQIQQGAPFDVFLSADMDFPRILHERGLTTEAPVIYAYGTLVAWRAGGGALSASLKELTAPDIRHIAIANPKTAPYGEAAQAALQKLNLYDNVQPKLVFGESIAQVNQYVLSGAAEIGFTAKSVVLDPKMKDKGRWVEVPARLYTPIAQGVVVLKRTRHLASARRFVAFLQSRTAKRIFEQYGYRI